MVGIDEECMILDIALLVMDIWRLLGYVIADSATYIKCQE
jgi:hypothetical protein